jgi:NADPH:quinone reductase-like Zn-dependent oxidoreductase
MAGVGITALRGLDDTLALKGGETVMIFGASGGVGHLAVQLAKQMGARVFAVASGDDGVALVRRLGADVAIDGHRDDVLVAARAFAPDGLDAALLTAGATKEIFAAVRDNGRVAYPRGVQPEPQAQSGVQFSGYYGSPDAEIVQKFHRSVERGPFTIHVARVFPLDRAAEAHRALNDHYLGKLALQVR